MKKHFAEITKLSFLRNLSDFSESTFLLDYHVVVVVSSTSISVSMLLMAFVVIFKVLEPRRYASDDVSKKNQVLALFHAIVV